MSSATSDTPSVATAPLLRIEGLSVRFGSFYALEEVDLEIQPGEFVALAGENGAGKSTLIRCVAGDITPSGGRILLAGERVASKPRATAQSGVAVVWQDLALCDNLDIASNMLLGHEDAGLFRSPTRLHATATALLERLGIPLHDTTRPVGSLSGGQRQLLAVARAMYGQPNLLIFDEPTTALGVTESAQVEALAASVRANGTTVLLVSHNIDQMFRLADRVVVLRHGRVVADLPTAGSRPDDVVAFITGQQSDSSARRQLNRLHGLADRLASADPSSSLALILSALGAALGTDRVCIHLADGQTLRAAGALQVPPALMRAWDALPFGPAGGPVGLAAETGRTVVDAHIDSSPAWQRWRAEAREAGVTSSWAVPVIGATGPTAVITVFGSRAGNPRADDLDLVTLYAGYVANVVERERLLGEVTARNRVLETIQEVLETLAGPIPLSDGVVAVLQSLRAGLGADEVGLLDEHTAPDALEPWLVLDASGARIAPPPGFATAAAELVGASNGDGKARSLLGRDDGCYLAVGFAAPGGAGALLAHWASGSLPVDSTTLLEDAANSLRLARERQESERARREASALRRSQELQRDFLSRLSHELRTPLTAIGGYASSLMQPDVTWDGDSERRFLTRISAESARLNRLVDDLLDFSAIESSTLRLHADWCELPLVLDAAVACVAPTDSSLVTVLCDPDLPVIWADHDRLEQVFVNLLDNAIRHNPSGTPIRVETRIGTEADGGIVVEVADDGAGVPADLAPGIFQLARRRRTPTSGAGLGLSIAKGIVDAHGGRIELIPATRGTRFAIHLPVERVGLSPHETEEPSDVETSRV